MKREKYHCQFFPALFLAVGIVASGCSDEEKEINITTKPGETIQFGLVKVESRTHYTDDRGEDGSYQIDWDMYDKIGIYSDIAVTANGQSHNAPYLISEVYDDNDPVHGYHGAILPAANEDVGDRTTIEKGLVWGDNLEELYTFYGAYPACRIADNGYPSSGNPCFTMDYITNQTDTVISVSNGVYTTKPDMLNAYMIARKQIYPTQDHILLAFDPIMTTLDITITAGRLQYEVGTGIIDPVTITGVSVIMPGKLNNGVLKYDAGKMPEEKGELVDYTKSEDNETNVESVFVGIDNYGERYVELNAGEKINLMAFLPPMEMGPGTKIKVHATGPLDFTFTLKEGQNYFKEQSRVDIQLPDIYPDDIVYNNWISQLDGNIPMKQLSIPGYVCNGSETATDIDNLLKKGIRAFDMEALFVKDYKVVYYNRYLTYEYTSVFSSFLKNNPKEFIIIWLENQDMVNRYEEYMGDFFTDNWNKTIPTYLKETTNKQVIAIKRNSVGNHFLPEDAILGGMNYLFGCSAIPDDYWDGLTHYYDDISSFTNNFKSNNSEWKAWYIDSWYVEDKAKEPNINKKVYQEIVNTIQQRGFTGIVMVPRANEFSYDKDYGNTYSDLLIQSIIDCNYKFILDRN